MTGKTTFLALFIVGLLVCPAAADSYSVTAPSSTIWALPGGAVSFPVSIVGTGTDGFSYADIGFQYNSSGSVLQLSSTNDVTRGALTSAWGGLTVGNSAAFTTAELYITGTQDPIINPSGTILNATFHVLSSSATIGSGTVITLSNYASDSIFTMSGGPTVNVIAAAEWKNNANGNSSVADNWKGPVPNGTGVWAILGTAVNTAGATVTLDQPLTLAQLTITPSTGGSYTLSGNVTNKLAMTNTGGAAALITVTSGRNTINAPFSFTNSLGIAVGSTAVATSNTTALSVSGVVTGTGSLTKDGLGLLAFGSSLSLGDSGSLLVNAGSMTTALSIVGTGSTVTVGVDATHTAVLTAKSARVHSLVLKQGSKLVLGSPTGAAGSADAGLLPGDFAGPGAGAGAAAAPSAVVPEPSTFALLAIAALCLPPLARRYWRRR